MNVCYFSKKCRFCQAFFEELSHTPFTKEIRFVCVDPSPSRPPLPAWLKSVPALVVAGEDTPRIGPSAVNNWLFERKLLSGGSTSSGSSSGGQHNASSKIPSYSAPQQQQQQQQRMRMPEPVSGSVAADSKQSPPVLPGSQAEGNIEAWHGAEMSGSAWSDEYSFLDDAFTSEKGYNPIVRNWESLAGPTTGRGEKGVGNRGGPQSSAAGGGARPSGGPAKSAKEEKLLKEFENFAKMRDMEFAPLRRQ